MASDASVMAEAHDADVPLAAGRWFRPSFWYGALALLIAAPLMRGGYLLLLDFALVHNVSVQWWPNAVHTGPVNIAPVVSALWLLVKLGWIAGPLLVCGLFFGMGLSMHRAVSTLIQPRSGAPALFAGTAYMVNPFVYERLMAGHLLFLIAYAIAPLVVVATVRCANEPGARNGLRWGLAATAIAWTSVHHLVILFALTIPLAFWQRPMRSRRGARAALIASGVFLVLNMWWLVAMFVQPPGSFITERDTGVYLTQPVGPSVIGNVAGLYGFWRHEFVLPKDGVSAWWLIAVPLAGLIVWGMVSAIRDPQRRAVGIPLMIVIPVSVLLASGTSFPPTKGVFLWLFRTVPGFALFREPQKWVALLPLSYAFLGAIGLDRILGKERRAEERTLRFATTAVTIAAVLVYGNALLWNWDRLRPTRFPSDWAKVEQVVRAGGGGTMLFLPWHQYLDLSFTGRRVTNPAPWYFSFPVLSGDNVEVPGIRSQSRDPRSRRIEEVLYTREGHARFVAVMQDLCVEWVALAHEVDFDRYSWLESSEGLEAAFAGDRITLYRIGMSSSC